jgi:hypothetical protein
MSCFGLAPMTAFGANEPFGLRHMPLQFPLRINIALKINALNSKELAF